MSELGQAKNSKDDGLPVTVSGADRPPLDRKNHYSHEQAYPNGVHAQAVGKDAFPWMPRRALHYISFLRFERKRERRQRIGHEVHPENMNRKKRHGKSDQRSEEERPYLA